MLLWNNQRTGNMNESRDISPLEQRVDIAWQRLQEAAGDLAWQPFAAELRQAFIRSEFLQQVTLSVPRQVYQWLSDDSLNVPLSAARINDYISTWLGECRDEAELYRRLRETKRYFQFHIIWRDLLAKASLDEVLLATSVLAESLIIAARDWLYRQLVERWGTPCSESGESQSLIILGMGKLGGGELNVSSDVDLIFVYPESGMTQGQRRSRDNHQFFERLGQQLIQALEKNTEHGQVYRVDMRLRPFGDSGPLVLNFAAMEDYYQEQGRDWERYAMLKARPLGPHHAAAEQLMTLLQPFVYRRYIDFSVIESLRQMKQLIRQEVRRRGLTNNIKLGAGGIREIEFIVQVFQLIRGGREPDLQQRSLLLALAKLPQHRLLDAGAVQQLTSAYRFLRKLEHALQGVRNEQTQTLPDGLVEQARLALIMEQPDVAALNRQLALHQQRVREQFDLVIGADDDPDDTTEDELWQWLWQGTVDEEQLEELLTEAGLDTSQHKRWYDGLQLLREQVQRRSMGLRGRAVLDQLMPRLLALSARVPAAEQAERLHRLVAVMTPVLTRTPYLELLLENPPALAQLVHLCGGGRWLAAELARYPVLLDELLEPAQLYKPTPLADYDSELRAFMLRIDIADLEQQMEALRQFKQIQQLRIAAADLAGNLPLMKVSDHLTRLAEVLLAYIVRLAWQQVALKHGVPQDHNGPEQCLLAVGYGKLGGYELGYGSDLDLVFLHDLPNGTTDGERPLSHEQFLIRLVQKVIHICTTRMSSGVLYDIDLRLRPSGNSGLLVSHINGYADYQQQDAWVWEHQALVRARPVFGTQLIEHFNAIRAQILCQQRDLSELAKAVVEMRHKMRHHLAKDDAQYFDLKQGHGGITDIEFIAQYLVLVHAHRHAQMTRWSDNIRIFEQASHCGLLSSEQQQALCDAYRTLRDASHRCALNESAALCVPDAPLSQARDVVIAAWNEQFSEVED